MTSELKSLQPSEKTTSSTEASSQDIPPIRAALRIIIESNTPHANKASTFNELSLRSRSSISPESFLSGSLASPLPRKPIPSSRQLEQEADPRSRRATSLESADRHWIEDRDRLGTSPLIPLERKLTPHSETKRNALQAKADSVIAQQEQSLARRQLDQFTNDYDFQLIPEDKILELLKFFSQNVADTQKIYPSGIFLATAQNVLNAVESVAAFFFLKKGKNYTRVLESYRSLLIENKYLDTENLIASIDFKFARKILITQLQNDFFSISQNLLKYKHLPMIDDATKKIIEDALLEAMQDCLNQIKIFHPDMEIEQSNTLCHAIKHTLFDAANLSLRGESPSKLCGILHSIFACCEEIISPELIAHWKDDFCKNHFQAK